MYFLYQIEPLRGEMSFRKLQQVHLAGCNKGIIPKYLKKIIKEEASEPYSWEISVPELIKILNLPGNSLVIDVKPNDVKYLMLFAIKKIWGYSSHGWTPVLLELIPILEDEPFKESYKDEFRLSDYDEDQIRFTFLYLRGTINKGKVEGGWNFPGPSSTNSLILWPDALKFFMSKLQ